MASLDEYKQKGYITERATAGHNDVFILEHDERPDLVYKEGEQDAIVRERYFADRFEEATEAIEAIGIPERVDGDEETLVYEEVGEPIKDRCEDLDREMGRLLGEIHSQPVQEDSFVWHDGERHEIERYGDFVDGMYEKILQRPMQDTHPDLLTTVSEWYEQEREEISFETVEPTLNHGDFVPQYVRYSEKEDTFYLIDFEFANIGDPMDDLAATCLHASSREDVLEGYRETADGEVDEDRLTFFMQMYLSYHTYEGVRDGYLSQEQAEEQLQDWLDVSV